MQGSVPHSEGFQYTDHRGAFEQDDQQGGDHVEKGHHQHDDDNHRCVDVVSIEPVEDGGVAFADVDNPQRVAFSRRSVEYQIVNGIGEGFES